VVSVAEEATCEARRRSAEAYADQVLAALGRLADLVHETARE
jgi:hypothetical protein